VQFLQPIEIAFEHVAAFAAGQDARRA